MTLRRSLPSRARVWVRRAWHELEMLPLGTHGMRKTFAIREFLQEDGVGKAGAALLAVACQHGHKRTLFVSPSCLDPEVAIPAGQGRLGVNCYRTHV